MDGPAFSASAFDPDAYHADEAVTSVGTGPHRGPAVLRLPVYEPVSVTDDIEALQLIEVI